MRIVRNLVIATAAVLFASTANAAVIVSETFESESLGNLPGGSSTVEGNWLVAFPSTTVVEVAGSKVLRFDNQSALIINTFNTLPGTVYTLSFDFGSTVGGESVQLSVMVSSGDNDLPTTNSATLLTRTLQFIATAASTTVIFSAQTDNGLPQRALIDNIFVSDDSTIPVIPEPSSLLLLGMGGIGLVGWSRRRRALTA